MVVGVEVVVSVGTEREIPEADLGAAGMNPEEVVVFLTEAVVVTVREVVRLALVREAVVEDIGVTMMYLTLDSNFPRQAQVGGMEEKHPML